MELRDYRKISIFIFFNKKMDIEPQNFNKHFDYTIKGNWAFYVLQKRDLLILFLADIAISLIALKS